MKPDVVLYEEALDEKTLAGAISAIRQADVLIVGGTEPHRLSGRRPARLLPR